MRIALRLAILLISLAVPVFGATEAPVVCPIDARTGLITYRDVVPVKGASAEVLYDRARLWIGKLHDSANAVITLDDKDGGRVATKGTFSVSTGLFPARVQYDLTIEVKSGKFGYTLTNLAILGEGSNAGSRSPIEQQIQNKTFWGRGAWENVHKECLGIVDVLSKAMSTPK